MSIQLVNEILVLVKYNFFKVFLMAGYCHIHGDSCIAKSNSSWKKFSQQLFSQFCTWLIQYFIYETTRRVMNPTFWPRIYLIRIKAIIYRISKIRIQYITFVLNLKWEEPYNIQEKAKTIFVQDFCLGSLSIRKYTGCSQNIRSIL